MIAWVAFIWQHLYVSYPRGHSLTLRVLDPQQSGQLMGAVDQNLASVARSCEEKLSSFGVRRKPTVEAPVFEDVADPIVDPATPLTKWPPTATTIRLAYAQIRPPPGRPAGQPEQMVHSSWRSGRHLTSRHHKRHRRARSRTQVIIGEIIIETWSLGVPARPCQQSTRKPVSRA